MPDPFDTPVQSGANTSRRRPLWMLALLAIGFGPLLTRLFLDEQLAGLTTQLVNGLGVAEHERSSIHSIRILIRFVLPVLVVLAVLRFTRLGQWIALTPLTLAFLAVGDVLLILNVVDQLRLYVLSGYPSFRLTGDVAAIIAATTFCLSAATLTIATIWYRSEESRRWLSKAGLRWFREA